jgi:hypothetical protein
MERTPIDSYKAQHSPSNQRDHEPVAHRCWRATARFQLPCHRLTFTWKVDQRLLSRNQVHVPLDRLRRRHAEVVRPSVRLEGRRQLHPIECLCGCNSLGEVDLRPTQSCVPVALQQGGSYPNTARLLRQTTAPTQPCPGWSSPLAGSVPTPQRHGCADSDSVLALLRLRKTPADKSVTSERAVGRYERLQKRR